MDDKSKVVFSYKEKTLYHFCFPFFLQTKFIEELELMVWILFHDIFILLQVKVIRKLTSIL